MHVNNSILNFNDQESSLIPWLPDDVINRDERLSLQREEGREKKEGEKKGKGIDNVRIFYSLPSSTLPRWQRGLADS